MLSLRNSKKPKNPKRKKRLQPNKRLFKEMNKHKIINFRKKSSPQMKKKMIQSLVLARNTETSRKVKMCLTPMASWMAKNKAMALKRSLRNHKLKFLQLKKVP